MNYYEENAKRFPVKRVTIPTRDHTVSKYMLEGDPNFVMLEVAKDLQSDQVTQMYDHMRLQVVKVEYVTKQGEWPLLRVEMYRNLYAGD